jgi:hypothetical protein
MMIPDVSFPDNMASIRQFFDSTRLRMEMKETEFGIEEGGNRETLVT